MESNRIDFLERFISVTDAAGYLGVTRQRVYQMIEEGKVHVVMVGKLRLLDRAEILRLREG